MAAGAAVLSSFVVEATREEHLRWLVRLLRHATQLVIFPSLDTLGTLMRAEWTGLPHASRPCGSSPWAFCIIVWAMLGCCDSKHAWVCIVQTGWRSSWCLKWRSDVVCALVSSKRGTAVQQPALCPVALEKT